MSIDASVTAAESPIPGLVSVVIPCYNSAAFVGQAIHSALQQTYHSVEIIVVNDGSTDRFDAAVAPFAARITIISQPNRGVSAARNQAIAACRGEFIAFLDADDCWLPGKLAAQLAVFHASAEVGFVHSERVAIDADGRQVSAPSRWPRARMQGSCLAALLEGNSIAVSSVVVRRQVLGDERFSPDVSSAEDWDVWLRLAARTQFAYLAEPQMQYRLHDSNASKNLGRMRRDELRIIDRLLAREQDADIRRRARIVRRRILKDVGHGAYEARDYRAASLAFLSAWRDLGWPELKRLAASFQGLVLGPPPAQGQSL